MASGGSVWNPDNIKDVAESLGIASLSSEVVDHLTRDVEFRIAQVLEEALKFMRHAKRTTLFTQDVSQALRVLDVEPLYGYESTRPLKFGEASIGPGQPLYYLDDEEVDFEKLINAPLPKVPREITFTAHWLAVEGVQPTIPQNPVPADARNMELLPKGPGANPHLAATAGADNVNIKPLVKHVLSKELQLYFQEVCKALLDETNNEYRNAAMASLERDPGLHQLVPYFVHFVSEKVTHNLRDLFVLRQMMELVKALLENKNLHMSPYIAAIIPPVLTCLVGKRLGPSTTSPLYAADTTALPAQYGLRDFAASILNKLYDQKYADATPTLKPRLARTLLKHLLTSSPQPLGAYYGVIRGLCGVAGAEGVRKLLIPNLLVLDEALKAERDEMIPGGNEDQTKERLKEIDAVTAAVINGLQLIKQDSVPGDNHDEQVSSDDKVKLVEIVGQVIGDRVWAIGDVGLMKAATQSDVL